MSLQLASSNDIKLPGEHLRRGARIREPRDFSRSGYNHGTEAGFFNIALPLLPRARHRALPMQTGGGGGGGGGGGYRRDGVKGTNSETHSDSQGGILNR